jgi:hypothetical protein
VPPPDERLFLHEVKNHAEFKVKLTRLRLTSDFEVFQAAVSGVVKGWFDLARQHAGELEKLDPVQMPRAVYSRAYYTAYNASKAVRYAAYGIVSLKSDDHQKVSELPDRFPNVDTWARNLQSLYEHRLRADYDNWGLTPGEHTIQPQGCSDLAKDFLSVCHSYLKDEYRIEL